MKKSEFVHPGEILFEEFMQPHDLSSNALARAIGVTSTRIIESVRGRCSITADMALRLAKFFGTDAQSWLNLQDQYALVVAERESADAIRKIDPLQAA